MPDRQQTTGSQTTTQSLNPMFQPVVNDILTKAQGQINNPLQYYPKSTVTPFSNQTQTALQGMQGLAMGGDPLGNTAYSNAMSMIGNQGTPQSILDALSPLRGISQGNIYVNPSQLQSVWGQASNLSPGTQAQNWASQGLNLPSTNNMQNAVNNLAGTAARQTGGTLSDIMSGANRINDPGFAGLASRLGGAANNYGLGGTASGSMLEGNPYFQQVLRDQQNDLRDQINRNFSASGRYGSGAHTGVLTEELGQLSNQALMQNYSMERSLQDQAQRYLMGNDLDRAGMQSGVLGQLAGIQGANIGNQLAGAGQLAGVQNQNYQNYLGGLQSVFNNQSQNLGTQLGAGQQIFQNDLSRLGTLGGLANNMTNVQATNIANRGGASQNIANQLRSGINDAISYSAMSPNLYSNMYQPYQQLANVGQTYDNQSQSLLNDAISRYDFNQTQGREPLNWLASLLSGTPGSGTGTSVTTQQRPSGGIQGALGGALGGATLGSTFGPVGTGIGGLLGGISGLF